MTIATRVDFDDPAVLAGLDPSGMRGLIEGLPGQVTSAWRAGLEWACGTGFERPRRVLVAGVGGSAIGADIVSALALAGSPVPVQVVRGYEAPPLDAGTLLVGCSFSGNTAETCAVLGDAQGPGARAVITTGGQLGATAVERGWPAFRYAFEGPPRSAIGWSTLPLLALLSTVGAITIDERAMGRLEVELRRAASALQVDVPGEGNVAKRLARVIAGQPVLVLGAGGLETAARRWAGQLSENAKQWAVAGGLPEANHNLLVSLSEGLFPSAAAQPFVVLLDAPALDARLTRQVALTAEALAASGVAHEVVRVGASSTLGAILEACQLGDWVSLYTSALNEVDPMPVVALDRFKARLAAGA